MRQKGRDSLGRGKGRVGELLHRIGVFTLSFETPADLLEAGDLGAQSGGGILLSAHLAPFSRTLRATDPRMPFKKPAASAWQ